MSQSALEHLEEAEAAVMSFISSISTTPPEEDIPDAFPVLLALLRHVSRAAGLLQAEALFSLSPLPPDPNWRCWRGFPPFCTSLDPFAHEAGYGCGLGTGKQT